MATTKPILHVAGRLIGFKNAGANGQLTNEGWAKYQTGEHTVYKNKLAYSVYDKKAQNKEKDQYITITCFGNRYDWVSENIGKSNIVFVSGVMSFEPTVGQNGVAYAGINIEVQTFDFANGSNGQGASNNQSQQGAPPQPQSSVPQNNPPVDDDLPF